MKCLTLWLEHTETTDQHKNQQDPPYRRIDDAEDHHSVANVPMQANRKWRIGKNKENARQRAEKNRRLLDGPALEQRRTRSCLAIIPSDHQPHDPLARRPG